MDQVDPAEQLKNVSQLKVYKYAYNNAFAEHAGLSEDELEDTGVIAQEVKEVLPDAVRETGDIILSDGQKIDNFLVVNKVIIAIQQFDKQVQTYLRRSRYQCESTVCTCN